MAGFVPGLKRRVEQRVTLSRALRSYRTPANDHLRRALRLSWVRAATALMHDRLDWADTHPTAEGAAQIRRFAPMFDGACTEVIDTITNLESGKTIGDSVIDDHLELLINQIGDHFKGDAIAVDQAVLFAETLGKLIGVRVEEIPLVLRRTAQNGISPNGAQLRNFAALFADEFAQVLQDPNYYPEAGEAFRILQLSANTQLLHEIKRELSAVARHDGAIDPVSVDLALSKVQDNWLANELRSNFDKVHARLVGIETGVAGVYDEIVAFRGEMREKLGREPYQSVVDSHTPTQTRTIMFAGFQSTDVRHDGPVTRMKDQISRKASRISESATIVPLSWDFAISERDEAHDSDYAKTQAWATINDDVVGAVLIMTGPLSAPIVPDADFLTEIAQQGWLAPRGPNADVNGLFDDTVGLEGRDRYDFLETRGGIPICYETRFALECMVRNISLSVVFLTGDAETSRPIASFRAFLETNGIDIVDFARQGQNNTWVSEFVASLPGVHRSSLPNPYRALDFYQVDDADAFRGRDREAGYAQTDIALALKENRPLILALTGPSGCGKSSFLRARVAAQAQANQDLIPLEMRPTDFQRGDGARVMCLPVILSKIGSLIGVAPPEQFTNGNAPHHSLLQKSIIKWLDDTLAQLKDPAKLLICIDQFEEILDDLSEGVNEDEWRALIAVLHHLGKTQCWPIVFTLEDSRKDRFDLHKASLGFDQAQLLALSDADQRFYQALIEEPFRSAGIDLDPEIVDELLAEVDALRGDDSTSASPLPLLALRLFGLFREFAPRAPKKVQETRLGQSFNRLLVTRADLAGTSLALGEMMSDLAETGWLVGGGKNDDDAIRYFLRPLVRISIDPKRPDDGKLVLRSVLSRGYRDEQRLHDAFRRLRLLVPSVGGYRLVHEAVIRRWPRAKRWFETDGQELRREAALRTAAIKWDEADKPDLNNIDPELINDAACILSTHVRDWGLFGTAQLDKESLLLRDYCIKAFARSATPTKRLYDDHLSHSHIHVAANYGMDDLLTRYIEIDPDCVNLKSAKTGRGPIGCAAWGHFSTVALLLKHGAKPSSRNANGFTDLDGAIWGEQDEILDLMLQYVDVTEWDKRRANPLSGAADRRRPDIAEKLVAAGFTYDQPCRNGRTPLHFAASVNDVENFRYFLERGDLTAKSTNGLTPLHDAALYGKVDIVEEILRHDAGAALIEDCKGTWGTPIMMAALNSQVEVVNFLMPFVSGINHVSENNYYKDHNALHLALSRYHSAPGQATEHMRRRIRGTVKTLLTDKALDVAAKAAVSRYRTARNSDARFTAWEMASGLPEVQRMIASHPNFPDALLEKLRNDERAKRLDKLRNDLFDAAKAGNRRSFDALLRREAPTQRNLDFKGKDGDSTVTTADLMLSNDWVDLILAMIESGQIKPWDVKSGYPGLYCKAIKTSHTELIDVLERTMPSALHTVTARALLIGLRHAGSDGIPDPDRRVADLLFARINDATATDQLFDMAHFGDMTSINDLKSCGADEAYIDDWGRTYKDVLPDQTRAELDLAPFEHSDNLHGDCLFYPDASGWAPLGNTAVVDEVDKSDAVVWDDRIIWSEQRLPFYPGENARLVRAKHPDWPAPAYAYWLCDGENLFRLNGTSPPIHEFNAKQETDFEGISGLQYLKFFCFFVHGDDGPFYILDGRRAAYFPKDLSADDKTRVDACFQSPRRYGVAQDGAFRISAMIYYANACFVADFLIEVSGMVRMQEDWPLIGDLSAVIDAPLV